MESQVIIILSYDQGIKIHWFRSWAKLRGLWRLRSSAGWREWNLRAWKTQPEWLPPRKCTPIAVLPECPGASCWLGPCRAHGRSFLRLPCIQLPRHGVCPWLSLNSFRKRVWTFCQPLLSSLRLTLRDPPTFRPALRSLPQLQRLYIYHLRNLLLNN